jgi:hypothetical protein
MKNINPLSAMGKLRRMATRSISPPKRNWCGPWVQLTVSTQV